MIASAVRRPMVTLLKLICLVTTLVLVSAIALLFLDVPTTMDGPALARRGELWHTIDAGLASQSWPVDKSRSAYRVFVFGGSLAFGSPYVHRDMNGTSRLLKLLDLPNRGGIATWLEAYLAHLLPEREVQVVNLAMPGAPIQPIVRLMTEVLEHGEPDLLLVLSGNNEGSIWEPEDILLGEEFDRYLREVEDRYRATVLELIARAQQRSVPLWLLTVPANLRDHLPTDRVSFDLEIALAAAAGGDCEAVDDLTAEVGEDNAVAMFLRARCLDRSGRPAQALPLYEVALQRDKIFQRVRPSYNAIVRSQAGSARVVDLEAYTRRHARDGITGDDIFLDSCHLRLSGNRLMSLELARIAGEELGVERARLEALAALPVEVLTADQLDRLYTAKRLKWLRLRLLSTTGSVRWRNRDRFARNLENAETALNDFSSSLHALDRDLHGVSPGYQAAPAGPR